MTESATPPADAPEDTKKRKILLTGAAIGGIALAIAGGVLYIKSAPTEAKPTDKQIKDVDLSDGGDAARTGSGLLGPQTIQMLQQKDGSYTGAAKLTAVDQDILLGDIEVSGDSGLSQTNNCPTSGTTLKLNKTCDITIYWRPQAGAQTALKLGSNPAANASPNSPAPAAGSQYILKVSIAAKSAKGGAYKPTDLVSQIAGLPVPTNQPGGTANVPTLDLNSGKAMNGTVNQATAPAGAYGPVAPGTGPLGNANGANTPGGYGAGGYNADTVANATQYDQNGQKILTPKERYILARRESAFTGATHPTGVVSAQEDGSWGSIRVPAVKSSKPQDMSRVLTMDRVITAVLVRTFDSRSSQQVIAQVDRNVYGAAGRNILIPRGSTVIGTMSVGAERAAVNWTQIIRPDGARFVMHATGGDAMGQAGVPGYTDHRYMKRFGAILLGTVLKSGVAVGTNASTTASSVPGSASGVVTSQNNGAIVSGIVSQDMNTIVQQIIAENSAIKPVTTVPAGTRVTIFPQQDLVLYPVDQQVIVTPDYPRQMNAGAQSSKYTTGDPKNSAEQRPAGTSGNSGTNPGTAPHSPTQTEQAEATKKTFQTTLNPHNLDVSNSVPWQN